MRFLLFSRKSLVKRGAACLLLLLGAMVLYIMYCRSTEAVRIVMGGRLYTSSAVVDTNIGHSQKEYDEKYFRPSKLPILNNKEFKTDFLWKYQEQEPGKIILPEYLNTTPEDALLNYYSILKHAANLREGSTAGCGTIGDAKLPYPVAYAFLTPDYQKRLPYSKYLESFEDIGHINLIKLKGIPRDKELSQYLRFFVELEAIEASSKGITDFAYYYGYILIAKEAKGYKIADIQLYGEDFLCAPYHGWSHDAEASVDIRYGEWCKLIKTRHPTKSNGYVKDLFFTGTDGKEYLIKFFRLTNGTDIEIAQYRKNSGGLWELITLIPEKCVEKKQ